MIIWNDLAVATGKRRPYWSRSTSVIQVLFFALLAWFYLRCCRVGWA